MDDPTVAISLRLSTWKKILEAEEAAQYLYEGERQALRSLAAEIARAERRLANEVEQHPGRHREPDERELLKQEEAKILADKLKDGRMP